MTSPTTPAPGAPSSPTTLVGAPRTSKRYYDEAGRLHTAAKPVPIDQYGRINGAEFGCRKCRTAKWFPLGLKGTPVCDSCDLRMTPVRLGKAPLLPWRELWDVAERPLRPVWALAGMAAAGYAVDAAAIPALVLAGVAPVAGVAAKRIAERQHVKAATARGRLEEDDPEGGKRLRAAIARRARTVGYGATAAVAWTAWAAATGVDPSTPAGKVALAAMGLLWLLPAASWWRKLRLARNQPTPEPDPDPVLAADTPPPMNPNEAQARRIWGMFIAARQGQIVGRTADGTPVPAPRTGKLADTHLEDWHEVVGGWAATAVSPPGMYVADNFLAARPAVASAFRMKTSMITCIPDADDETRALFLAQRSSPIVNAVRWTGPESINVERGVAPVARYIDGGDVTYELYRPGWGVPHVAAFGTTGSGKSEFLNQLFTIDRWAHYTDEHGVNHGLVADFLIDPQQGQSFAPFLDDLAAPVASSIEEAMLLLHALTQEMLRRNRYLAREAKTWDPKRNKWRTGRKWWNPLVDGPILALTIDEAHDYLSYRPFSELVTKAGRMWRKCGGQLRIATHTPLLGDLGGSMALRDMLTGGFVWVGRTANSLSGPTAFNVRLPVDPRTIPTIPGMSYILTGLEPKPMLARTMFEPDYYDWVRDADDNPIGYPATLPPETLAGMGSGFTQWVAARARDEAWVPDTAVVNETADQSDQSVKAIDCVRSALAGSRQPMSMDDLDTAMRGSGWTYSTRTLRDALKRLREAGLVSTTGNRHELTPLAREDLAAQMAEGAR